MFGAEIRDAQRVFEGGAGRDYFLEDAPQMVCAERPLVERDDPFEHLALAHRLVDGGAVAVLQEADALCDGGRAD